MVVDQGFEPCRSSPSDRSPGIIKPRRTTKCCLPLKFVEVGVRFELTVLGICSPLHWATLPSDLWCCWRGLNSRLLPYQGSTLPLSYNSLENQGVHFCRGPGRVYFMPPLPACLGLLLDGLQRNSQRKLVA